MGRKWPFLRCAAPEAVCDALRSGILVLFSLEVEAQAELQLAFATVWPWLEEIGRPKGVVVSPSEAMAAAFLKDERVDSAYGRAERAESTF